MWHPQNEDAIRWRTAFIAGSPGGIMGVFLQYGVFQCSLANREPVRLPPKISLEERIRRAVRWYGETEQNRRVLETGGSLPGK